MTSPIGRKNGKYAVKPGGRHAAPSVTAVIGVLDKPALSWGAAKETALFARFHPEEWMHLPDDEAVDRLRKHHRGVWDRKANIGSLTHAVNEAWVNGASMGPEDVDDFLPRNERGNPEAQHLLWAEALPYIDGLEAFWGDVEPEWVQTERCVFSDESGLEYGGQFDILAICHSTLWRLDIKTGALSKDTGLPYPETAMQLTAYDRAPHMGVYDMATGELTGTEPNVRAECCGVLHIPGDGSWNVYEYVTDDEVWDYFRHARRLWGWLAHSKKVVGPALPWPHPSRVAEGNALFADINRLQEASA